MNVGQICSRNVASLPASAPLHDVARLMHDRHVGAIVLTRAPLDQPVPVGMITDRDIVRAQLDRAADLTRIRAEDVMSREPLVLNEHEPVDEAIAKLRRRGVRRAPVVDQHGALVGLISTDDLIAETARELGALANALQREPCHEGERV